MQIAGIDVYRFRLPFIRPLSVGREVLPVREGFILALTDSDGRTGYGEIAPLPGFDETTPEQCLRELSSLPGILNHADLRYDRFDLTVPLFGLLSVSPSGTSHTLFGIESALLGLCLQRGSAGPSGFSPRFPETLRVPVSGLFIPDSEDEGIARQVRDLQESGVKTVKVKIGRLPVDEEIRQILDLSARMGNALVLRLDGNRNLSADAYRRFGEALGSLAVEYVEEPLRDGELTTAEEMALWPLALDESLTGLLDRSDPRPSRLSPSVRTIILKPGLLMGLHAMARCIADANRAGIKTVLSSAFNTGLTLAILGVFARLAALPPGTAHGLDTLHYLADDVLSEPPVIREGMLLISRGRVSDGWHLDHRRLRKENG